MTKSLVFVPNEHMHKEVEKLRLKYAEYKDNNISNFYSEYIKKICTNESGSYEKRREYDAVVRLRESIVLTTNSAEGYNSDANYSTNFKKLTKVEILKIMLNRHALIKQKIKENIRDIKNSKPLPSHEKYKSLLFVMDCYNEFVGADFLKSISRIYKWCD